MNLESIYKKMGAGIELSPEEEKYLRNTIDTNVAALDRVNSINRHGEQFVNAQQQGEEAGFVRQTGRAIWGAANDMIYQGVELTHIVAEMAASTAGVYKVKSPDNPEGDWKFLSDKEKAEIEYGKTNFDPITGAATRTPSDKTILGQPFKDINIDRPEMSGKLYEDGLRVLLRYAVAAHPALRMAKALKLSNAFATGAAASTLTSTLATSTEDSTLGNLVVDTGIIDPILKGATPEQRKDIIDYLTVTEEDTTLGAKAQVVLQDLLGEGVALGVFKTLGTLKNTSQVQSLLRKAEPVTQPVKEGAKAIASKVKETAGAASSAAKDLGGQYAEGGIRQVLKDPSGEYYSFAKKVGKETDQLLNDFVDFFNTKPGTSAQTLGELLDIEVLKKNYHDPIHPSKIKSLSKEIDAAEKAKGIKKEKAPKATTEERLAVAKEMVEEGGTRAAPILEKVVDDNLKLLRTIEKQDSPLSKTFGDIANSIETIQADMKGADIPKDYATLISEAYTSVRAASKFTVDGEFNSRLFTQAAGVDNIPSARKHVEDLGGLINMKNQPPEVRALLHGAEVGITETAAVTNPASLKSMVEELTNSGLDAGVSPELLQSTVSAVENAGAVSFATRYRLDQLAPEFSRLYKEIDSIKTTGKAWKDVPDSLKRTWFDVFDEFQQLTGGYADLGTHTARMLKFRDPAFYKSLNNEPDLFQKTLSDLKDSTKKMKTSDISASEALLTHAQRKTIRESLDSGGAVDAETSRKLEFLFEATRNTKQAVDDAGTPLPTTALGEKINAAGLDNLAHKTGLHKLNAGLETMVRWYQNGLLMNPSTAKFNLVNVGVRSAQNIVETLIAAKFFDKTGVIKSDEAYIRIAQLFTLLPEAIMASKHAVVTGVSKHGVFRKYDAGEELTNVLSSMDMWKEADSWAKKGALMWNQLNEAGFRTQMTIDEFGGYLIEGSEKLALAERYANHITTGVKMGENLVGSKEDIVRQLYHGDGRNPILKRFSDEIELQANAKKTELLFGNGLVEEHSWLSTKIGYSDQSLASLFSHIRDYPVLSSMMRIQIPFYNVAVNIIKAGVELTPVLQFTSKRFALAMTGNLGAEAQAMAKARAALGSLIFGGYMMLAANGQMVGAYPSNYRKGRVVTDDNFMPFAITDGDYFYQMRGSAPADFVGKSARIFYGIYEATAMALTSGAITVDEARQSIEMQGDAQASLVGMIADNLSGLLEGNPMTEGVGKAAALFGDNPRGRKAALTSIANALNPTMSVASGAKRWVGDQINPEKKDTYSREFWTSYANKMKEQNFLFADDLDLRVNILGEPIYKNLEDWHSGQETSTDILPRMAIMLQGGVAAVKPRSQAPLMKELWRLKAQYEPPVYFSTVRFVGTESHGIKTNKGFTYHLTKEQKRTWVSSTTEIVAKEIAPIIKKKWYKDLSDVEKRLELEIRIKDAKQRGREVLYATHPEILLAKQEWKQRVDENPFPELDFISR